MPFELVLSRHPPALDIQAKRGEPLTAEEGKDKWRHCLSKKLEEASTRLRKSQERYKRNYDNRLRRKLETIKKNDSIFLRVERRNESQIRHKLASVAEGPYLIDSVKGNTVVILRTDGTIKRVSRDRVTLAPKQISAAEARLTTGPLTDEELMPTEYPVAEAVNLRDVVTAPDTAVEVNADKPTYDIQAAQRRNDGQNSEVATQETEHTDGQDKRRRSKHQADIRRAIRKHTEERNQSEKKEYIMDQIVGHDVNEDDGNTLAKVGDTLYRVRWYGYGQEEDTLEPIHHLPRNKVMPYCKRKRIPTPVNIHEAQKG